jgi:hypothetical protein
MPVIPGTHKSIPSHGALFSVRIAARISAIPFFVKPNYTRSCQPEFKTCYDAITVVGSDGKLSMVKVTKDMNDKILRREVCSFNDAVDTCYDWDDGTARRDMKDWYKVADQ